MQKDILAGLSQIYNATNRYPHSYHIKLKAIKKIKKCKKSFYDFICCFSVEKLDISWHQ